MTTAEVLRKIRRELYMNATEATTKAVCDIVAVELAERDQIIAKLRAAARSDLYDGRMPIEED